MLYKAVDLSKYIVSKCVTDGYPISNLHLQKILYYIQKDFLKRDRIAFADEIEAWQFGPVVPNVYYKFCGFGAMPITSSYSEIEPAIAADDLHAINSIVDEKRLKDPWDLVAETHKPNGAWAQVYRDGVGNHAVISRDLIKAEE